MVKVRNPKLAHWQKFAIWTEAEFVQLCAGFDPHGNNDAAAEKRFEEAIKNQVDQMVIRAVEAGLLPVVSGDIGPTSEALSCRFRAVDAIKWAAHLFPDFPFELVEQGEQGQLPKPKSAHSPKWSKWVHMRDVEIWQAVALSLDIEPAFIEQFHHWTVPGVQHFSNPPDEFKDRLDIVIGRFHDIEPPGRTLRRRPEPNYSVNLSRLIAFAKKVGWTYPVELDKVLEASVEENRMLQVERAETIDVKAANNEHHSDKLRILIQASDRFWATADRNDRKLQPDKADIVEWLIGRGFTKTLAGDASKIIRPDWAIDGRPPEED